MSNPGVITLGSCETKSGGNFRIEDNIGECIHIHYANLRFDFTIEEFLACEDQILEATLSLMSVDGFDLKDFDIGFLAGIGNKLIDLERIEYDEVDLLELKVFSEKTIVPTLVNISDSMMVEALKGETKAYEGYAQGNSFEVDNLTRLRGVENYVRNNENIKPIILFNSQLIIRDGQHRASVLYTLNHKRVRVLKMIFKNEKYNLSTQPVLDYIFRWDIERLKNLYRWGRKKRTSLVHRVKYKAQRIIHRI